LLDEYYSRIALINSNPDLLKNKSDEEKTKLKTALDDVSKKMDGSEKELEDAMKTFINTFDELGLSGETGKEKTRGLTLKTGTNLPRQLINDVTIMTLKNF
jgi:vacuolar-type H+-ATPase subunit D/Vma8